MTGSVPPSVLGRVNIHLTGPDHEVDMHHADVATARLEVCVRQVFRAFEREFVGPSQGQVAGGILVDQRVDR